jgi:hypothetical protein
VKGITHIPENEHPCLNFGSWGTIYGQILANCGGIDHTDAGSSLPLQRNFSGSWRFSVAERLKTFFGLSQSWRARQQQNTRTTHKKKGTLE